MYGAILGNKFSGDDYNAIMNYARVAPPSPKTNYVDIAGGNSAIDLTEAVGGVVYEDGSIEFKFTLFSSRQTDQMMNDLHGKRMKIVLEREPEFFYDGRLTCTKVEQAGRLYELYITARVYPYKREKAESIYIDFVSGQEKEILLMNDTMPVMPEISVEGVIILSYGGVRYRLTSGEYQIPEVTLYDGLNRIRLSGNGEIKFTYRKGRLA